MGELNNIYEISGKKVSEIVQNKLPQPKSLFYLVSKDSSNEYILSSASIQYAQLSGKILADVIATLGLGTMSREEKWFYSLSSHNHDELYSRVRIHDLYDTEDETQSLKIADITIKNNDDVNVYHLKTPKIITYKFSESKEGTLKFVCINNNKWTLKEYADGSKNIDVEDDNFDGWVFPNGGYLDPINYQLPNLNKFLKIAYQKTNRVTFKNIVKTHTHNDITGLNVRLRGTLDIYKCMIPVSSGFGQSGKIAHMGGNGNYCSAKVRFDMSNSVLRGLYTQNVLNQLDQKETMPYHNLMPVMIYIGHTKDN